MLPIPGSSHMNVNGNGQLLNIVGIMSIDAGPYFCRADNGETGESNRVNIEVESRFGLCVSWLVI